MCLFDVFVHGASDVMVTYVKRVSGKRALIVLKNICNMVAAFLKVAGGFVYVI